MSGGQKARLSLARALYSNLEVYLLDDPLSAVDTHVGEQIFKKAIKHLLADKTVLLNTHHLYFARQCDNIILLDEGKVVAEGSYQNLVQRYPDIFENLMKDVEKERKQMSTVKRSTVRKSGSVARERTVGGGTKQKLEEEKKLYKEESHDEVSWSTYKKYIQACGGYCQALLVLLILMVY